MISRSEIRQRVKEVRAWTEIVEIFLVARSHWGVCDSMSIGYERDLNALGQIRVLTGLVDKIEHRINFIREYGWIHRTWLPTVKLPTSIFGGTQWVGKRIGLEDALLATHALCRGRQRYKKMRHLNGRDLVDISAETYEICIKEMLPEIMKVSDKIGADLQEVRSMPRYEDVFDKFWGPDKSFFERKHEERMKSPGFREAFETASAEIEASQKRST